MLMYRYMTTFLENKEREILILTPDDPSIKERGYLLFAKLAPTCID